ncbi:MAG: transglutaminase-like domain-containing protein [Candidatus ainarchaeum sp.]|nr:transglutaminase-like domain-containing protein [Candidatus ainarchaeum sp.]
MKTYLSLIFVVLLFANSYSYETVRYIYEKSWYLTGELGAEYILNGTFLVNNSQQKILSFNLSEGELISEGENILFYSKGAMDSKNKQITATAKIEILYHPFLSKDYPLDSIPEPKNEMEIQAHTLSDSSSIAKTIILLSEWINGYIEYDLDYSNITSPQEVFDKKKGVCSAYTALFQELISYLGIENRQVSGFSDSLFWQPHAWAQVKIGEEWISVDPTYNQIGILSSDHIKVHVGNNSLSSKDSISSFGGIHTFYSDSEITEYYVHKNPLPIKHEIYLSNGKMELNISNPSEEFIFVPVNIRVSDGWGELFNKIILLAPGEKTTINYYITPDKEIDISYSKIYSIPFILNIMEVESEGQIKYSAQPETDHFTSDFPELNCLPPLFIIPLILFAFFRKG